MDGNHNTACLCKNIPWNDSGSVEKTETFFPFREEQGEFVVIICTGNFAAQVRNFGGIYTHVTTTHLIYRSYDAKFHLYRVQYLRHAVVNRLNRIWNIGVMLGNAVNAQIAGLTRYNVKSEIILGELKLHKSPFADFLQRLFYDGEIILREPPHSTPADERHARAELAKAYRTYSLEIAGSEIAFDAGVALAAAELLRQASWLLFDHSQPAAVMQKILRMPRLPNRPSHHLSADLLFRYLPTVHRRACSIDAAEPLSVHLAQVFRQWPLSGVLSDVNEAPRTFDLGRHPGLLWLYAERWCIKEKTEWLPQGQGMEYLELIFAESGKDFSPFQQAMSNKMEQAG